MVPDTLESCDQAARRAGLFMAGVCLILSAGFGSAAGSAPAPSSPARAAEVTGELKRWHPVTLTIHGPWAEESDPSVNPFTDYRFEVIFKPPAGERAYRVPGYFAADGDAANTSATSGDCWRAHLSPDTVGIWNYRVRFEKKSGVGDGGYQALAPWDGMSGRFEISETDKAGPDFRGRGRLEYTGGHHLRFAGDGRYFLKVGADSPETLLAYVDFDNTFTRRGWTRLKTWAPHVRDWREGDPTWQDGKGKGLIGAINYLADAGANAMSFIPYNLGGDGDNVWPMVDPGDKLRYDCSKLDQWRIVLEHAQTRGVFLHFKLQETENDDGRHPEHNGAVPAALDGGELGPERRLYLREMIARFGYNLALNWNLGEENSQTPAQQRAMADYIRDTDPYGHPIVIQTFPHEQDQVYTPLLGRGSALTGASLQNLWSDTHERTLQWVRASAASGRPWVVCNDEQNHWTTGTPPDLGYEGYDGTDKDGQPVQTTDDIRQQVLWGNLMAGGAGVEHYFGYDLPQSDLFCEDWRSREQTWRYGRIAIDFFQGYDIPFWEMTNRDQAVGVPAEGRILYCLGRDNGPYLVYRTLEGAIVLDLRHESGAFVVRWFNPRAGGPLMVGSVDRVFGGAWADLGQPPDDPQADWLAVVRRDETGTRR